MWAIAGKPMKSMLYFMFLSYYLFISLGTNIVYANEFYFYNIVKSSNAKIISQNCLKGHESYSENEDRIVDYKTIKNLIEPRLNQPVLIIRHSKIFHDNIKSFYAYQYVGNDEYFLRFNFYKNKVNDNDLYIVITDTKQVTYKYPPAIIDNIPQSKNKVIALNKLVSKYFINSQNKAELEYIINNINDREKYEDELNKNYNINSYKIKTNNSSQLYISQYTSNIDINNHTNFLIIYIGNKIIFKRASILLSTFTIHNKFYILLFEYVPYTGATTKCLYLLENDNLHSVDYDDSFSD